MQGASEVGFTVLSMSTSLVAVFIPILLMGGMIGRLFREFAVVLSVAVLDLAGDLADHHADDVRPRAQAGEGPGPGTAVSGERAGVRLGAGPLSKRACPGPCAIR